MKYLLNYSHPLNAKTKAQIAEREGDFLEVKVPCQIDFSSPLRPQLDALIEAGHAAVYAAMPEKPSSIWTAWPKLFVPPALSFAAAYVSGVWLNGDDGMSWTTAGMVVLSRTNSIAPEFELNDIVYA